MSYPGIAKLHGSPLDLAPDLRPRSTLIAEHAAIANLIAPFERTIVECHPALIGPRCFAFGLGQGARRENIRSDL